METFLLFFLFLFGLSMGSFISCWVYRINNQNSSTSEESWRPLSRLPATIRGVLSSRSVCDHCQKQLAWHDNIPLISFLFLRGKSRCCHSPIPFQYFLVELSTALLTIIVYHILIYDIWSFGFILLIIYALIAIFVSDLNYQTVPDIVVWPAIVMAIGYNATMLQGDKASENLIIALVAGFSFFLLSRLKIKGRQVMGFGDVEIVILMGLFLGFPKIIVALYLAFLTGALIGVILILSGKKKFGQTIPFGPFLAGATIISFFYGGIIWQKIAGLL